jgi:hypothetical protein
MRFNEAQERGRQRWLSRMRPFIDRHFFGIGATVVVVALCLGWAVNDRVTQADAAADDANLTVRTCIGANAKGGPLEEALIKEDIIEEDLLQTTVTNGMCNDMLDPIPGGTPVRKLVAAQNYLQEIELIEGAMRGAAGEAAARGPGRGSSSAESSDLFRTIAHTSEQAPALAQYDEPGDGGTEVIEPRKRQAAAAASAGEDADASIPDRLDQKEAVLREEGASAREAAAGSRCSLEVDVLDEELDKNEGLYKITPYVPNKVRQKEAAQVGLRVLPVTRERFQEIRRTHRFVADASESDSGCVKLTDWMKAQLAPYPYDPDESVIELQQPDDIRELSSNRDTIWGWGITARQTGEIGLLLNLRYAISREGKEFRLIPGSPIFEGEIKVTPLQGDSTQQDTERPWWRGILETISGLFGA